MSQSQKSKLQTAVADHSMSSVHCSLGVAEVGSLHSGGVAGMFHYESLSGAGCLRNNTDYFGINPMGCA